MEKYQVIKNFEDKITSQYYTKGTIYSSTNNDRIQKLKKGGYIMDQQMNQNNNRSGYEAAKTSINGKEMTVEQAAAIQEAAEANNNQTGIQAHHDNTTEAVHSGQVAQNASDLNVKQSGQAHMEQFAAEAMQQMEQKQMNQQKQMQQAQVQQEAASAEVSVNHEVKQKKAAARNTTQAAE